MPFKFSRCLCLQTPDVDRAVAFYHRVMGLEVTYRDGNNAELEAGSYRLFIDQGPCLGPIMEFLVPNVEVAKEELLQVGCEVVRWEGAGGCCYLRDPFGFVFNVYEEPGSFQH
jgi:catechol 2,3-dioxygenase-like lactoylglutathione lyase family enzyme